MKTEYQRSNVDDINIKAPLSFSWYLVIYRIPRLGGFQIIRRNHLRDLPRFGPLPHLVKVPTGMPRVEVHKRLWCIRIRPDLSQHRDIHRTHQLLS